MHSSDKDCDAIETSLDGQGKATVTCDFGPTNAGKPVKVFFDITSQMTNFRGSRKLMLDMLDMAEWPSKLNQLIGPSEVCVSSNPQPIPSGHSSASETDLDTYIARHRKGVWPAAESALNQGRWWAPLGGMRPQMDLICQINIDRKDGLLFVEAKAHETELDWGGKQLKETASEESRQNHDSICDQISVASIGLNTIYTGFSLTPYTHYQLVNRLAYLWKLAHSGIPVVLLYLGFTNDKSFPDYIRDAAHWQRIMGGYMQGVVPHGFPEHKHELTNGASIRMLVRSLEVTG